jgi:hypothetical protein
MEINPSAMQVQEEMKAIPLEIADWEMIKRALIVYSASLEVDKSAAATRERGFAISLQNNIGFQL